MKRCHTHAQRLCFRCFLFTLGFPVEHVLWEKVPGFAWVTLHVLHV